MEPRDPSREPSGYFLGPYARMLTPRLSRELRGWTLVSVAALAVAGVFALLLAVSRAPGLGELVPWPEDFFKRGLIVHVIFSFQVFYLGMLGALCTVATCRAGKGRPRAGFLGPAGLGLVAAGFLPLLGPALLGGGTPTLNNYVPAIADPAFYAGLAMLAVGTALPVLRLFANLDRGEWRDPVAFTLAAAGLAYLLALITFTIAIARTPGTLAPDSLHETLFWGGGHLLQFVNTLMVLAAWWLLAGIALAETPVSPRLQRWLAGTLAATCLAGPVLVTIHALPSFAHRDAFTTLMWMGQAFQPALAMAGVAAVVLRSRKALPWRNPAFLALATSVLLFALGGLLGFFVGQGDTRTPAHYHALIGGINLGLMGLTFALLLPLLGRPARAGRRLLAMFWLYAAGQTMFAAGLFLAGTQGVARKTAGAAQGLDSIEKVAAMGLMATGGVVAVAGGVMFVWISLRRLLTRKP